MPQLVTAGAMLKCSFGTAPSSLVVPPANMVNASSKPAATIMDNKPMMNIMPFGMCTCPANPIVAAATSAAMGVLTPQPCIPVTSSPWTPGSPTVMIKNFPALNSSSTCMCNWGRRHSHHSSRSTDRKRKIGEQPGINVSLVRNRVPSPPERIDGDLSHSLIVFRQNLQVLLYFT